VRPAAAIILTGWLLLAVPAAKAQTTTTSSSTSTTIIIGGGGGARRDCLLVLGLAPTIPARRPRHYRCADGDACDADGMVNGVCQFSLNACSNSTFDARCASPGVASSIVDHALDNGDPAFDTEFQALQNVINTLDFESDTPDDCTTAINFHIPVQGPFVGNACRRNRKVLRIRTESDFAGGMVIDRDRLRMICDPSPLGCDPQVLYASAFDRIQRQIFNQSCAVSGCHDSQTYQSSGNLLLEQGASYANLVNVTPDNDAAEAAGLPDEARRPRDALRLVGAQRLLDRRGAGEGVGEDHRVLHRLAGPLPEIGRHGVGGVAEQGAERRGVDPRQLVQLFARDPSAAGFDLADGGPVHGESRGHIGLREAEPLPRRPKPSRQLVAFHEPPRFPLTGA